MTNKKAGIMYSIVAGCFLLTMVMETARNGFDAWSVIHIGLAVCFGGLAISSFRAGDDNKKKKTKTK